ncbi:DoxX family protein [Chitinophaga sp.]|uniref:DoxX family protein n=1 Tax=Chitinophaga sp. TaxID=1869181 RepID=UPI002C758895|nr:DoxX family protein [Chitinophaga sp.]HWV67712.1 DoxX family protein [Chitinophaga sp.]
MTIKAKRILSTVLMAIPILVLMMGGVMKLANAEPPSVVRFLTKYGFGDYMKLLGTGELIIAALLLYPKTNKLGFLLASCYLGGAFCLEISGSQPPASAVFLAILWVGMFLRSREMFLQGAANNN